MTEENYVYLTVDQIREAREIARWAADFRRKERLKKVHRELAKLSAQHLLEDC